jgi:tetratricopeptide (TPR) repeat protein
LGKFILFYLLWRITGNPILAILVLFILFYFLDLRYVGIFPSVTKPYHLARRTAKLQAELRLNPHHTGNKQELARIFITKRQYDKALPYIQEVHEKDPDSAEVLYELGLCHLKTGYVEKGESMILSALQDNPLLKYGEPYLHLVEVFSKKNVQKALNYIEQVRKIHSSSVETYYRLGNLLLNLDRKTEAQSAFHEALAIYQSLPKYLRRQQRKWSILSRLKSLIRN